MPANWQMIPRIQVIRIPQRIFPLTFFTIRIPVIRTPKIARSTVIPASLMDAVRPSARVFVVAVNREQTYKRCSTDHDLRILKTKECDEETDSNADRFL